MATHYVSTSGTYSVSDAAQGGYTGTVSGTLSVTVNGDGSCSWSANISHPSYNYFRIYVAIGGTARKDEYIKISNTKSSSFSGTCTVSGGSVAISFGLSASINSTSTSYMTFTTGTLTRSYWTDGTAPTCGISQTAGNNTITFSGKLGSSGTNNAMSSATLYYWMNGATSYASQALTATSGGDWKVTKTANQDDEVWAYVTCAYPHGNKSCTAVSRNCYYYSAGGTPTCAISQSVGSNTVTISGSRGADGSHNGKVTSKLYYNLGKGGSNVEVNLGTTGSNSYTKTLTMDSSNNNKTISAYVCTDYTYGDNKYGYATSITSKYYSSVGTGTVTITDNGNNTFTLKGTKGSDGYNNAATGPTLSWGYDTNYSNSFTSGDTKDLAIKTPANATRTVYAKSVTGKTNYGSAKEATTSLAVKQYVAPSSPSGIILSYDKSRLTVKENWKLKWTGGTETNGSSPVKGYRIRTWVKRAGKSSFTTIQLKNDKDEIKTTTSGSDANKYYYDRENTTTEMTVYPVNNDFKPGDQVYFTISCYTRNANGSNAGLHSTSITSSTYTVQNAGIVRVKVGGSWKEGQVWIKTGGAWKEASSVHAKVSGSWKEST